MEQIDREEMKRIEIDILDYIDTTCRELGIQYFLGAGTLIGAVRHKGFIPWDDDIDLFMPRDQYERFIDATSGKDSKYLVLSTVSSDDYYYPWVKVVDRRTIVVDKFNKDYANNGIWVDIFPLDSCGNDVDFKKTKRMNREFTLSSFKKTYPNPNFFKNVLKHILHFFFRFTNPRSISKKIDNYSKSRSLEGDFYFIGLSPVGPRDLFLKKWFDDVVYLDFEGKKYPCPAGYDSILRKRYGKYMELPPEENRASAHMFEAYWRV